MHYFIKYNRKSGDVFAYFISSTNTITYIPRFPGEAAIEVTTDDEIKVLDSFDPMADRLKGRVDGGVVQRLRAEPIHSGHILLECDQSDLDGDGLPELAADGTSIARITAKIVGH